MNIIAFILGIFLIFAISTNTFFKNSQQSKIIEKSYLGYMKASNEAYSKEERSYFDDIKSIKNYTEEDDNSSNKPSSNKSSSNKEAETRNINPQKAKLNIYPLFEDKEKNKEIYNIFAKLIKILYSNKSFYKKNLEYDLINNMLLSYEKSLQTPKDKNLINLKLKDDLQLIYYKILQGTKFYDFEKKLGTPSLLDYVQFDTKIKKIPIIDASQELLISIFNEKIAKEIEVLQKESPLKQLTLERLNNICNKYNFSLDEKILSLFDFSHISKSDDNIIVVDEGTSIKIKKEKR